MNPPDSDIAADPGAGGTSRSHRLAAELTELARCDPEALADRIRELDTRDLAEFTLRLPADGRLRLIQNAPKPMRLARSLPDGDFYLTVRELGPIDAMPLVRLASARQLHHLIDLESWRADRFDPVRSGGWVAVFLEAGEPALRRFLRTADTELLSLLIRQWVQIEEIEFEDSPDKHGHGLSESGTEQAFMTPDGNYRFSPMIPEHAPAVQRMLRMLFVEQPDRYRAVMWDATWELPSDLEEQAFHWRQSRMEEHGFPSLDEAHEVYLPPGREVRAAKPSRLDSEDEILSTSRLVLQSHVPLAQTIDELPDERRERLLQETVSIANRILIADGADTGDPEAHRAGLDKAMAFIGVALEVRGARDVAQVRSAILTTPMLELFREGWSFAAELGREAQIWFREGWARGGHGELSRLDSPLYERVGALIGPRPVYVEFDDERPEAMRREFADLHELEESRVALEMAAFLGDLVLERIGFSRTTLADTVTFSTVLLTMLGRHAASGELRTAPLDDVTMATFLRTVASRRTAPPDAAERSFERMVDAFAERWSLTTRERTLLGSFGRFCVERLRDECGNLDPGVPVDPRYVTCVLIAS